MGTRDVTTKEQNHEKNKYIADRCCSFRTRLAAEYGGSFGRTLFGGQSVGLAGSGAVFASQSVMISSSG